MSTLTGIIPAAYRKRVYAVYAIVGVILGAVQVGFGAAEASTPVWLTVALAVYAFVGGAVGATAQQNTDPNIALKRPEA